MKKIVSIIRPFQKEQTVMVYEDGNKIDIMQGSLDELGAVIYSLSQKHEISRVDLAGPKRFLAGIKEQLGTDFIQKKFDLKHPIEINII